MISRRLSKIQKEEILEAFTAGENTNFLAEKYGCTPNTINRTVKGLLSDSEYTLLKEKRSRISREKGRIVENQTLKENKEDLEHRKALNTFEEKSDENNLNIKSNSELGVELDETIDNKLELIAPLLSDFDFHQDNPKTDFEILNYESLPESVYMIVDKKVELELQIISDLSEWSFLPEDELKRSAIVLFANQRSAKRNCSRNQRVIKIPNTSVFKISRSYLISKGVTRLILDDSIIALDN